MRRFFFALALASVAGSASAHDFWLQMKTYRVPVGAVVPLTIQVGHAAARQRWSGSLERVVGFRSIGPGGAVDLKGTLKQTEDADAVLRFSAPGTHVVAFESTRAMSDLPSIRFNDYAKLEGLTPALEYRARTKTSDAPGRESYSRRAKALVEVARLDAGDDRRVTTPLGMTLEIVPEKNPYALKPRELLPVRILYEGKPLPGALVKLTSLEFDAHPIATRLSDAAGRASFDVPRSGTWLINVIWTKRITGDPKADFDTTFSSLTFAFLPKLPGE